MAQTHHEWATKKRNTYLHEQAMKRKKVAVKAKAANDKAMAERNASIDAGAKADAELQFGDQRNALSKLINEAPARGATINATYDSAQQRLKAIADSQAVAAKSLMGQVLGDMGTVQDQGARYSDAAGDAAAAMGGVALPSEDAASFADQEANSAAYQGAMANVGLHPLYSMQGVNELKRGEEMGAQRGRDQAIKDQFAGVLKQMGAAESQSKADRRTAYATSDAAQATADAENRKIDVSRQASIDSNQAKKAASAIIFLEKMGLGQMISAEKGSPQGMDPNIVSAVMNIAGVGGGNRPRGSKLRNPPPRPKATRKKASKKKKG